MLKNYLKIAVRHLKQHKGYTSINVAGLAVGMACCMLIYLFVQDERQYDRFHENADRIYRVVNDRQVGDNITARAWTPPAMGPTLREEFPEVLEAVRFFALGKTLVERDEMQAFERNVVLADSSVFKVFSFQLTQGDPATALTAPHSLVLSRSMAQKYFGEEDPLGQTLTLSGDDVFTITGIFEDLPAQSHLQIDLMGSFSTMRSFVSEERLSNWIWQQFYNYVLLPEGYNPALLEAKLPDLLTRYADPETTPHGFTYQSSRLQPLTDIYLHSANLEFDNGPRGNITYVYSFSAIALFILLIACFNFMNLATARSMRRAKEVGLRKVIGAQRGQLIRQFLGESVLMALLALTLAILLVHLILPVFNAFTGKAIALNYAQNIGFVLGLLAGCLTVGLFAGSYPALFLSSFAPIKVLKGHGSSEGGLTVLRKGLVVAQFVISTMLIVGTGVVYQQFSYLQNKSLGFEAEQVVVLQLRGDMRRNQDAIKAELLQHPGVVSAAASWGVPGEWAAGDGIRLPNSDTQWSINMMLGDHDFIDTYEMTLAAGRGFSRDFSTDAQEAFILNETAARSQGWSPEEAVGQELLWDEWSTGEVREGHVIGVVRDFHFRSLHQTIEPLVLLMDAPSLGLVSVRIRPENMEATLGHLQMVWETWAPARPFEYEFLDADLAEEYIAEQRLGTLASVFAGLAILIACLGLFGLAAFTAERRTKEIGVRKVLGASVPGVVVLLSKDFTRLVLVAFVVAVPLAYLSMQRWLEGFAYHVDIGIGVFLLAGGAVLGIAWLTVSYQSIKAAVVNPVKSLRYE